MSAAGSTRSRRAPDPFLGRGTLLGVIGIRFTAIIPIVLGITGFVLTLVLVIAGMKPGMLNDFNMLQLNTSSVGQNLITFTPTTSANATSTNPVGNFFNGILNSITNNADDGLTNLENSIVSGATSSMNIPKEFKIFVNNICQIGNSTSNATTCYSISKSIKNLANSTSGIQSSMVIGTTNVSIPLLAEVQSLPSTLGDQLNSISKAVLAFYILSLIGSAVLIIASNLSAIFRHSSMVAYAALGGATLSTIFQLVGSILSTILAMFVASIVNQVGSGLTINANSGGKFIAITWVSFVLLFFANVYWFIVWFVEFRTISFKARRRTEDEIGNYKTIIKEVVSDLRVNKYEKDTFI